MFRPLLRYKISCSFSPSPFANLLLPSSSYPWLPMVVSFFLTHLLHEVASPIIYLPSLFLCHWYTRSKGLHWWRRSKAYKLHMEPHHVVSRASSSRWCCFLYLFVRSIHFSSLFFILFSMYILHCLVVWFCLE